MVPAPLAARGNRTLRPVVGGFYGADAIASGMLEAADNGCLEAVEAERYSTGKAKAIKRVEYVLERD